MADEAMLACFPVRAQAAFDPGARCDQPPSQGLAPSNEVMKPVISPFVGRRSLFPPRSTRTAWARLLLGAVCSTAIFLQFSGGRREEKEIAGRKGFPPSVATEQHTSSVR